MSYVSGLSNVSTTCPYFNYKNESIVPTISMTVWALGIKVLFCISAQIR